MDQSSRREMWIMRTRMVMALVQDPRLRFPSVFLENTY